MVEKIKSWYCPVVTRNNIIECNNVNCPLGYHPLKLIGKEIFKNYSGNFQCKSILSGVEIPFYNGKYYY